MIQKMFTIYDSKALAFLPPFFLNEKGQAARTFADCCNSTDHQFGAHPEDYTLFYIGTFDNESGVVDTLLAHESMGLGLEYLKVTPDPDTLGLFPDPMDKIDEKPLSNDAPVLTSPKSGNSS